VIRGLLSGVSLGAIVSAAGLSVFSLMSEQPAGNAPPQPPGITAPEVADAAPATDAAPEPEGGVMTEAPSLASAPGVAAPVPETDAPIVADAPDAPPVVGSISGDLGAPEVSAAPAVTAEIEQPVLPSPQSDSPQTPVTEADLSVAADQSAVPAPIDAGDGPEASEPVIVLDTDPAPVAPEASVEQTEVPAANAAPEVSVEPTPEQAPETMAEAPGAPPPVGLSGELAGTMPSGTASVRVIRPETAPATQPAPQAQALVPGLSGRALDDYASEAVETLGRPMLSVVLIDDGSLGQGSDAIAAAGLPVSVAIDVTNPDAAEMMRNYRAKGIEVLAIVDLPQGASASDVAVTLEAAFDILPEAIGYLDLGSNRAIGTDRDATGQLMSELAAAGRGYITLEKGIGASLRAAEVAEVPATSVYRDLDSDGQSAQVIRRFLDQAAFRARQQSGAVLVGRVRPDTISALIMWETANRAGQVAQVPVSMVLMAE